MNIVKIASILTLIGGIIEMLIAIIVAIILIVLLFTVNISGLTYQEHEVGVVIFIFWTLYMLVGNTLVIVASQKMKNSEKRKKWSIIVIIFSVLGTGTIFGVIGGILGLVAEDFKTKHNKYFIT